MFRLLHSVVINVLLWTVMFCLVHSEWEMFCYEFKRTSDMNNMFMSESSIFFLISSLVIDSYNKNEISILSSIQYLTIVYSFKKSCTHFYVLILFPVRSCQTLLAFTKILVRVLSAPYKLLQRWYPLLSMEFGVSMQSASWLIRRWGLYNCFEQSCNWYKA